MSEYQMPPPNKVNSPQPGNGDEETIDLLELLYALLGKWREIAAATVACALIAAIGVLFFVTPKYQASSTIYVISRKDSDINMSDLQIGTALTDDYIQVFHMWEVQDKVISNLDLPYTYSQLDKMLSVTNASNTRMVEITVTSESAQEAADIANEYVTVVQDYIAKRWQRTRSLSCPQHWFLRSRSARTRPKASCWEHCWALWSVRVSLL